MGFTSASWGWGGGGEKGSMSSLEWGGGEGGRIVPAHVTHA